MGDVEGPEKANDTCVKTMHAGMMDRGFTVSRSVAHSSSYGQILTKLTRQVF
jgi:hypothetical protein